MLPTPFRRHRPIVLALAAGTAAGVASLWVLLVDRPAPLAVVEAPPAPRPALAPVELKLAERIDPPATLTRGLAAIPASAIEPGLPIPLLPPVEALDAVTLKAGGRVLRLAGLEGPSWDASCLDGTGAPWACGLRGRAALHNRVARAEGECRPVGPERDGSTPVTCRVSGENLAGRVVAEGWARPAAEPGSFPAELERARQGRAGLWNGGWQIRQPARQAAPAGRS